MNKIIIRSRSFLPFFFSLALFNLGLVSFVLLFCLWPSSQLPSHTFISFLRLNKGVGSCEERHKIKKTNDNERSPAVEASRRWNKRQGNRFIASLSTLQELLSLSFTLTVYGFVVCLLKPTRRINRKNSVKDDLFFPFVFIFLFLPTGLLFQCCLQLTASKHIELQHWNRREKPVGNKMKKIKDKETPEKWK